MQPKIGVKLQILALALATATTISPLFAQDAPAVSLGDQLQAQYTMVKMGTDSNGMAVLEPGTVLTIQKGGILGFPPSSTVTFPSKYQDGNLHSPNSIMQRMAKDGRFLTKGEKVYPTKINVNVDKDKISFQVIECDSCNGVQQPAFFKSEVVFEFPKGSLKSTGVSHVEDTIGQVFAFDQGGDSNQGQASGGDQGGQQQQQNQGQQQDQGQQQQSQGQQQQPQGQPQAQTNDQQPQQQNQAAPQTIQLGETPDQVQAALGQPEKIVNLGTKQIYVYKDLKITFLKGKVTDVE